MTNAAICPTCNATLPENSSNCPKCLLQAGLDIGESEVGETEHFGDRFAMPSLNTIAELFPQLEIIDVIGRGGMGVVFKARQPSLDRMVALKILPTEIARDANFAERFAREAKTLAMLSHPNIVSIYDSGQVTVAGPDGGTEQLAYLLLEYVDGVNLREVMRDGGLSPSEALAIVPQVCDALQFAHDAGVVHRDIKPENVLLDTQGKVKVADFGLAKLVGNAPQEQHLTRTHQVMGTPHYIAPEQISTPLRVDHRADIYALGILFYEMLTGDLPVGRFPLPSEKLDTDARLDDVVLKAMDREPSQRYQHASDVKLEVQSLGSSPPVREDTPQAISDDECIALARSRVRIPAIAMIVLGVINLVIPVVLGMVAFVALAIFDGGSFGFGMLGFMEIIVLGGSMLTGIPMIVGGLMMRDLRSHSWAVAGAIVALFPGSLFWFFSLGAGIWALWALSRDPVGRAFDVVRKRGETPVKPAHLAQRSLVIPSICLSVHACIRLLMLPVLVLVGVRMENVALTVFGFGFVTLLLVPIVVVELLGARAMRRGGSFAASANAAWAAMIPLSPFWFISLPVGIWTLLTLVRDDVKDYFARQNPGAPLTIFTPLLFCSIAGSIVLAILSVLLLMPVAVRREAGRPVMQEVFRFDNSVVTYYDDGGRDQGTIEFPTDVQLRQSVDKRLGELSSSCNFSIQQRRRGICQLNYHNADPRRNELAHERLATRGDFGVFLLADKAMDKELIAKAKKISASEVDMRDSKSEETAISGWLWLNHPLHVDLEGRYPNLVFRSRGNATQVLVWQTQLDFASEFVTSTRVTEANSADALMKLDIRFDPDHQQQLHDYASTIQDESSSNRYLAIMMDNRLLDIVQVVDEMDSVRVLGTFEELSELSHIIQSGTMPMPIEFLSQTYYQP